MERALFEASATRVGSESPSEWCAGSAALAALVDLGPWLAANWGVLADVDPELLDETAF
jgi:hypothetical protein